MKKKKDVSIAITSTQTAQSDSNTTELLTFGKYLYNGGSCKIEYNETESTGFDGCRVTLDVSDKSVVMKRRGSAISDMIIELGKKHHCHYGTPYGDFMLGITTDEINPVFSENGGSLKLKYTVDINSSLLSMNEMQINIKEVQNDRES